MQQVVRVAKSPKSNRYNANTVQKNASRKRAESMKMQNLTKLHWLKYATAVHILVFLHCLLQRELGVEQSSLRDIRIKHSDPGDCLREVLYNQLNRCSTTWGDIITVLRSPRIGEFQLADNLEAKYYPSELA